MVVVSVGVEGLGRSGLKIVVGRLVIGLRVVND